MGLRIGPRLHLHYRGNCLHTASSRKAVTLGLPLKEEVLAIICTPSSGETLGKSAFALLVQKQLSLFPQEEAVARSLTIPFLGEAAFVLAAHKQSPPGSP